jgi:hypothetical protein
MNDHFATAEDRLIAQLQNEIRGPTQNGIFALWLFLRVCDGILAPDPLSNRARKRRLEALERRLSSLSLQPLLRRTLLGTLRELSPATADSVVTSLQLLAKPARDSLGPGAGEAIALALRAAQGTAEVSRQGRP